MTPAYYLFAEPRMKVYISVDLEGVSGVVASHQCTSTLGAPLETRRNVTADVNAAIAGARSRGATSIWVNENHSGRDLLCDDLDPIAEVLTGKPKPLMTLEGLDSSFACVFMIGAHAAAGTERAFLTIHGRQSAFKTSVNDVGWGRA
jgi:D-amino peptidase